jgi:hypothetical protein
MFVSIGLRALKNPALVPILSPMISFHFLQSYFFKKYFTYCYRPVYALVFVAGFFLQDSYETSVSTFACVCTVKIGHSL